MKKAALLDAVELAEPQFVAVYGRRRIGKTYLVREVLHDNFCVDWNGQAQDDEMQNRRGPNCV